MGKGDKKTKRGKIIIGSFGKTRPHKKKQSAQMTASKAPAEKKPSAAKAKSPAAAKASKKTKSEPEKQKDESGKETLPAGRQEAEKS